MTAITAEDYRTAAKVAASSVVAQTRDMGAIWNKQADRLEAAAARDTEAEELAKLLVGSFPDNSRWDWLDVARAALDHLGERGRLTPEGGTTRACGAETPDGAEEHAAWVCTLDQAHGSLHEARDGDTVWHQWADARFSPRISRVSILRPSRRQLLPTSASPPTAGKSATGSSTAGCLEPS